MRRQGKQRIDTGVLAGALIAALALVGLFRPLAQAAQPVRIGFGMALTGGLAANGEFGIVRWDEHFTIDEESAPGQATCEGRGFLPLILRVSSSLIASIQLYLADKRQVNWNVSARNAESF